MRPLNLKKNKNAGFTYIFIFIIMAFSIALICGIYIYMAGEIRDALLESDVAKKNVSSSSYSNYSEIFEEQMGGLYRGLTPLRWISYFLIMGMIIAIFIGSYMVKSKPVYFVPYIFICVIAIIIAFYMATAYEMMIKEDTGLAMEFAKMQGTNWMILNLPLIVAVVSVVGGIIMYASWRAVADVF